MGLFTLTAPTGVGKTMAMIHFALRHCVQHQLPRIIVVLPFLTLAEQLQKEYEHIFPEILVDHSQENLPEAARELADYAAGYGITTLLENHGFFVNGSDRVIRLIHEVDRPNYGLLLDTGNFLCVDEDPLGAAARCAPLAKMVHLKDFYVRQAERLTGVGGLFRCDAGSWFSTNSGLYMLRGSILAQGDLDVWKTLKLIRDSGYDGYVSVEFEGMEDGEVGSIVGMHAARYILDRA